jgi:hypothetical protein
MLQPQGSYQQPNTYMQNPQYQQQAYAQQQSYAQQNAMNLFNEMKGIVYQYSMQGKIDHQQAMWLNSVVDNEFQMGRIANTAIQAWGHQFVRPESVRLLAESRVIAMMNNMRSSMPNMQWQNVPQQQYYQPQRQPYGYNEFGGRYDNSTSIYENNRRQQYDREYSGYSAPTQGQNPVYTQSQQPVSASKPSQPIAEVKHSDFEVAKPEVKDNPEYERRIKKGECHIINLSKILAKVVDRETNRTYVGHAVDVASIELETPVQSVEQAVSDIKSIAGATGSDEYAVVAKVKQTCTIHESFEYIKAKFEEVMKIITGDKGDYENGDGDTDYDKYVACAIDVMREVKKQGAAFSSAIESLVVKKFNEAKNVVFTQTKKDGTRTSIGDIESFSDIEEVIKCRNDPDMAIWDDPTTFSYTICLMLEHSLFSIFNRNGRRYLDPSVDKDREIIKHLPNIDIRVDDVPLRSYVADTDEKKTKLSNALKSVFVLLTDEYICYHNVDILKGADDKGACDFKLHDLKDSTESVVAAYITKQVGRVVSAVQENNAAQLKHPVMIGVAFDLVCRYKRMP